MKKLKLNFNDLKVESFNIQNIETARGTVKGQKTYTDPEVCETKLSCFDSCDESCQVGTCNYSCDGTCYISCNGSCHISCNRTCNYSCDGNCYTNTPSCGPCPNTDPYICDPIDKR